MIDKSGMNADECVCIKNAVYHIKNGEEMIDKSGMNVENAVQIVVALVKNDGVGFGIQGRCIAMLTGAFRSLCYLNGVGKINLNKDVVHQHIEIDALVGFSKNPDIPIKIRRSVQHYLEAIPGYKEDKDIHQEAVVFEYHKKATKELHKIIDNLVDAYGDFFRKMHLAAPCTQA